MKNYKLLKVILVMISFFATVISFVYALFMFILPKEHINIMDTMTFLEVVNKYDCRVESVTDDDFKSDNYYVSVKDSCPVEISYRVFTETKAEEAFHDKLLNDMKNKDHGVTTNAEINMFGFDYDFNSISGKYYQAVVRNRNTILYVSSDIDDKDIAVNILKDSKYYYEVNKDNLILFLIPGGCSIMFIGSLIWVIVTELKKKPIENR